MWNLLNMWTVKKTKAQFIHAEARRTLNIYLGGQISLLKIVIEWILVKGAYILGRYIDIPMLLTTIYLLSHSRLPVICNFECKHKLVFAIQKPWSHMEKLSTVFIFSAIKYITIVKQITPRPAVEDVFQCMPNMPSSSLSMGESWKRADVKNVETGLNNFLAEKIFWSLFRDTFLAGFAHITSWSRVKHYRHSGQVLASRVDICDSIPSVFSRIENAPSIFQSIFTLFDIN